MAPAPSGAGERLLDLGDGVELCVETFGQPDDPTVLLVGGAAQSMVWWETAFCRRLAAGGRHVVRYDHRETGRSTTSPAGRPRGTAADLAEDPATILRALDAGAAHVVGLSLGGGLAQVLAVRHPSLVATLTLVATTAAGPGDGTPLPGPSAAVVEAAEHPPPDPDWSDRDAVLAHRVDVERPCAGALGFDEARVRRLAGLELDRTADPAASLANHFLLADDPWPDGATLADVGARTLVLHGTTDPVFPLEHGRALARRLPRAALVELPGAGHEQPPPPLWDLAVTALLRHTGG
ncbi:alpha/beta fold hydrolase [Microlunatus capsulatus]|uniref:Pimeloyl-ACP methyl ester carboxylesterase n=1 Tax=Microlunatus capsulatus TaxID=99117 RepID=A0ABS4Z286_9ACTN|nr:alpha/beta fold hydrolase [Microlunatus capsulatus]MBP2415164.1 pimeloyl-ACP methyl ester carboxylesterase [Microlunatus capsulatus]